MTSNHCTHDDARRLQALHAQELRGALTPEEIAEANALRDRAAALKIIEGFYVIAGSDRDTEAAFQELWDALILEHLGGTNDRMLGYAIALTALLRKPDALVAALRFLRDGLLATEPQLMQLLHVLAADLEGDDGAH
jgi:hypothetical protein